MTHRGPAAPVAPTMVDIGTAAVFATALERRRCRP